MLLREYVDPPIINRSSEPTLIWEQFDPTTYQVPLTPSNPAEVNLYREFTALKSRGVQTWIAIGGFDFSDPGTSTFRAWYFSLCPMTRTRF